MESSRTELHLEVTNTSARAVIADAFRWSGTLSRVWSVRFGPARFSAVPGLGFERTQIDGLLENPWVEGVHGRLAGRIDTGVFPGFRVFAEYAATYMTVLPSGRRALDRIASPSPPCTNGYCVAPFSEAWTRTFRMGGMLVLF
jgi:hypothetical protein